MKQTIETPNHGDWKQCVAVATGLAGLLATQVIAAWALSSLLLG